MAVTSAQGLPSSCTDRDEMHVPVGRIPAEVSARLAPVDLYGYIELDLPSSLAPTHVDHWQTF